MNAHPDRRTVAALLALLCIAAPLPFATPAGAATYHAYLCRVPYGPDAGRPAPTDGTTYATNGTFVVASQNCAGGGAMTAAMDGGTTHPYGDRAAVTFTAPAGLAIAGFRLWRHEAVGPTQPFGAPATNLTYSGGQSVNGICAQSLGCGGHGDPGQPLTAANEVAVANLAGVTQVTWDAGCGGGPGGVCPASGSGTLSAVYNVFAADMLLDDPAPPAVGEVAGPLLGGGTLRGAQSVSFNVTDAGSGVHKGILVVDGAPRTETVLDANGGACADLGVSADQRPAFVNTQPCPASLSGLLTLDTDALTPGAHALTVLVADAAGNRAVASTTSITVAGTVAPGTPNGSGASRAAKLTAGFPRHGRVRRLGLRTRPTISGRLVDESGRPIASAAIALLVRERRAGARSTPIATAATGADGRFRARLPGGPSRTISVAYTAFSGDAKPARTVRLSALVRARVTARVRPRAARVGEPIRISGRLSYAPRGGIDVRIQARDGRRWRTIDVVETGRDGRFSWPYRFKPGAAGKTFAFRARVASKLYPFEPAVSRPVFVSVR